MTDSQAYDVDYADLSQSQLQEIIRRLSATVQRYDRLRNNASQGKTICKPS
jgi:hypothetical protein